MIWSEGRCGYNDLVSYPLLTVRCVVTQVAFVLVLGAHTVRLSWPEASTKSGLQIKYHVYEVEGMLPFAFISD